MRTAVIVIGDLGRSPRMQYHAVSLAEAGGDVDLIGLEGAPVIPAIAANARIHVHRMPDRAFSGREGGGTTRFVVASMARAAGQAMRLLAMLWRIPKPSTILVQNPPAFPTLFVCWLVSRLRGARFVIDWHNLSHTIAAVKLGDHHRAVKAVARSEKRWAGRADAHLAVSNALADWLSREYHVQATVVYDRPAAPFEKAPEQAAADLWTRIAHQMQLPNERLPIVVCPTSWTPDEDFDLLLEALERAERQLGGESARLLVLLTGRGQLRASFEARLSKRQLKSIAVRTLWLEPADYPVLIGMAELGLCLHQSSSGLDLPMKLADLRGAGVPVAVYDYSPVLGEVMTKGQEGVLFRDPGELAKLFAAIGRPSADAGLAQSRAWLAHHPPERWATQWNQSARPVLVR